MDAVAHYTEATDPQRPVACFDETDNLFAFLDANRRWRKVKATRAPHGGGFRRLHARTHCFCCPRAVRTRAALGNLSPHCPHSSRERSHGGAMSAIDTGIDRTRRYDTDTTIQSVRMLHPRGKDGPREGGQNIPFLISDPSKRPRVQYRMFFAYSSTSPNGIASRPTKIVWKRSIRIAWRNR